MSPEEIYEDMLRMFGSLPHPDHEPKRCQWFMKIYKYRKGQKPKN